MTAVEWLIDKYTTQNGVIAAADYHTAKEMEKQQIVKAYEDGSYDSPLRVGDKEQYYNEKFKK